MAQYQGRIAGQRGEATRLGSKASGLQVSAQGWGGRVTVDLWHDPTDGRDHYRVCLGPHSQDEGQTIELASGHMDEAGRSAMALSLGVAS